MFGLGMASRRGEHKRRGIPSTPWMLEGAGRPLVTVRVIDTGLAARGFEDPEHTDVRGRRGAGPGNDRWLGDCRKARRSRLHCVTASVNTLRFSPDAGLRKSRSSETDTIAGAGSCTSPPHRNRRRAARDLRAGPGAHEELEQGHGRRGQQAGSAPLNSTAPTTSPHWV